ncbi:MAG: hypothetical protein WAS27_00025 [Candidatus Saccharimonadales bacterium]
MTSEQSDGMRGEIDERDYLDSHRMAIRYEEALRTIVEQATALNSEVFATQEEAEGYADQLADLWSERHGAYIAGMAHETVVTCEGPTVLVANMRVTELEHDGYTGVFTGYNTEEPYRPLEFMETVSGTYQGMSAQIQERQEGYTVGVSIIFSDLHTVGVTMSGNLFAGKVQPTFRVTCGSDTTLSFPGNERHHRFRHSVDTIAAKGLARSRLLTTIHKLSALMHAEEPNMYQEMRQVDRLRWLGRQSEQYAEYPEIMMAIQDALTSTFADRTVYVSHAVAGKGEDTVNATEKCGRIVDVLLIENEDSIVTPALSLEWVSADGQPPIANIPLKDIYSLRF